LSDPININLTKKVFNAITFGRGLRGYGVEIDISEAGMLQWRQLYTGAPWNDLIAMSALKGDTGAPGEPAHIHIKWHAEGSEALLSTPDAYIGIYADNTVADSTVYADYQWFKYKGDKGNAAPNTIWQYSADGTTWTTDATGALYERQSGDNGTTWSAAHEYPGVAALAGKANVTDVNAAMALKAPLNSPALTGTPTAPTQTAGDNSTKIATTAYSDALVVDAITDGVTGIAPSQNAVFDALALKADITLLNTEKQLLTQEIDSLKKSAVENSNAPYLTASDYSSVALAKNSVGVGTVGIDGVTVENQLLNGDASQGITNWNVLYFTVDTSNGYFHLTSSAPYPNIRQNVVCNKGDTIYVQFKTRRQDGGNINVILRDVVNAKEQNIYPASTSGSAAAWTNYKYLVTVTLNNPSQIWLRNFERLGYWVDFDDIVFINLTTCGLASLTAAQLAKLLPTYFSGKKTFGGIGCLVTENADSNEVGRQYFTTDPMYSNATAKDVLTYDSGKYYHTHNVDSSGIAIATPYDTEVEVNGQFLALSNGTVTYEPWFPDIGIYTDKFTLSKAITAVKELYKYGSATPIIDAVIASDGLSFTSASLASGDLAYGVFEFSEPLRPLMTIKSRNDDATVADTANGKIYTFRPVITNGAIASWTVTEV